MMYQDEKFMNSYNELIYSKVSIEDMISQLFIYIKSNKAINELKKVEQMIKKTFDCFDDCIAIMEDGRQELAKVAKNLVKNIQE